MDPVTIIVVIVLIGLAIVYKDISAFVVLTMAACIWTVLLLMAVSVAWFVCCVIEGFQLLLSKKE